MSLPSDTFPTITTTRCLLRNITGDDQRYIFEGLSHPEVIKYYGVSYKTFEETSLQMDFYKALLENGTGIWWAICLKESREFMGACGFNNHNREHRRAEIGFWMLPRYCTGQRP